MKTCRNILNVITLQTDIHVTSELYSTPLCRVVNTALALF